jgi:hypothetical protein
MENSRNFHELPSLTGDTGMYRVSKPWCPEEWISVIDAMVHVLAAELSTQATDVISLFFYVVEDERPRSM